MQNKKSCLLSAVQFVILLLSVSPILFAQGVVFNGPRDYVVGTGPDSVIVADFNGDGLPDIAVANGISNDISVLLQKSDGTFQTAVSYPVGNQPVALQVDHVSNDGKLDLLVINSLDNTLSVLLGNGDGTFQTQKVTALPGNLAGQSGLAVGDFNGDGSLDVAVTVPLPQAGTYGLAVMLGNGDGTFQAAVDYAINGQSLALAAVDLNKDGKVDLLATYGNGVSVCCSVTATGLSRPRSTRPSQAPHPGW